MNKNIYKIVNYVAMSDGGVYPYSNKDEYFFAMNMLEEHKDFMEWIKITIENFTSCTLTKRTLQNDGFNRKPQLRLQSKTHPYFKKIREHLYIDGYKGLNSHYLKMIDAEALAILYMCDGCLGTEKPNKKKGLINSSYNVTLNLKRLSEGDTLMLKQAIKSKLNLEFNICRQYADGRRKKNWYYLRLRGKDIDNFMNLVSPYIMTSFNYKLKNSNG
jgi:hypothetical protein